MSDLIDRQAAIDIISQHTFYNDYDDTDKCSLLDGLRALQSAQPKRIKGRWIPVGGALYQCDQCGVVSLKRKFCSECGADMREVTE